MIGPIRNMRLYPLELRHAAQQKVAEGLSRNVDVMSVAVDEIHRRVERVIDIAFEPETAFEDKWQHAGPLVIDIGPDLTAIG